MTLQRKLITLMFHALIFYVFLTMTPCDKNYYSYHSEISEGKVQESKEH